MFKKAIVLFSGLINSTYKFIILKGSQNFRIQYLRKKGVIIGTNCVVNIVDFSTEPYLVSLGNNVSISTGSKFITHDGSVKCFKPQLKGGIFGKISVGNNVFFGDNCIVLPNTQIGDNCIIGAGSVVRGKIPEGSVVIGNPAKVLLSTNVQKFLFEINPGLIQTDNLSTKEKDKLVKQYFNII